MRKITRLHGHDRMDCCLATLAISMYLASEPNPIRACFTDLKQTHCQLFLQQKWVCCRMSKELQCGVCTTTVIHRQSRFTPPSPRLPQPLSAPAWQGKIGKGSWEGYSKQSSFFSLAELLPGKERSLSSSYWALHSR